MSDLVVDSSVVFKWFVAEDDSDIAHSILEAWQQMKLKCHAPDWMLAEVGNILWKRQRRAEITTVFASECLNDVDALPLVWADSRSLLPAAMTLAMTHGRTVYDSIYLALAIQLGCPFVTADDRLANAVAPHILNVVKLSEWKPSPPTTSPPATPSSP
ncbi:MAG: type II toxin-antitoxin system VapC family toxin [Candidatus Saccharimonas sp.]|nr:type II toxin-antitoxin system VapC family toxin [Planctomycetaceae bacterium]